MMLKELFRKDAFDFEMMHRGVLSSSFLTAVAVFQFLETWKIQLWLHLKTLISKSLDNLHSFFWFCYFI